MKRVRLEDEGKKPFRDVVQGVCAEHEAWIVSGPDGDLVRVLPVPKPVRFHKGRPVYRLEDMQFLDFPYPPADTDEPPKA